MQAHIRRATKKEMPDSGWMQGHVCAINGVVHSTFRSWRNEMAIPSLNLTFKAVREADALVYELPDGQSLTITCPNIWWTFDGVDVRDHWATPRQRELVCGSRVFRVKPEDDTILFNFTEEVPDLRTPLIGFYLYLGPPGSGA